MLVNHMFLQGEMGTGGGGTAAGAAVESPTTASTDGPATAAQPAASGDTEGATPTEKYVPHSRFNEVIRDRNALRQEFGSLKQTYEQIAAQNAALVQQLQAVQGTQDKLRQVFSPEPAAPEWEDPVEKRQAELDARLKAVEEYRENSLLQADAARIDQEISKAREQHPIPDLVMPTVFAIAKANPNVPMREIVKHVSAQYRQAIDQHVKSSAPAQPPPDLMRASPVLPTEQRPRTVKEAHKRLADYLRSHGG